jgi:hypothetical protein
MHWLPWHRFTVDSRYPPADVAALLASQVGPERWFSYGADKPFRGTIGADAFVVTRVIRGRNSFLPVVSGRIEARGGGSRVHVLMRLHVLVAVFMTLWLGAVGTGFVMVAAASLRNDGNARAGLLPAGGMFVFGVLLTCLAFGFEARKQEPMLRAILTGGEA